MDSGKSVSSREDSASQVRHEHVYRIRGRHFNLKQRRYIIGPFTCDFGLQNATQALPGTGGKAHAAEMSQGTEDHDGSGGGGGPDDGASEQDASDKEDSDEAEVIEQKSESGRKRKRKVLEAGSNAVAHALVKRCMPLWMRDAIGPSMGDNPSNTQRSAIAINAVKLFQMTNLDDFTKGKDPVFEQRMKDCANQADKVLQSLLRVCCAFHVP